MGQVITGLERWLAGEATTVGPGSGARIGLLAHPSSVDGRAHHVLERLAAIPDARLTRLLAPEHGLWGHEQDMETVRDARDPVSGLPVVSLYGADADSLRPRPADLDGLDAIVCDLQDVGSRYYTYVYTVTYVMEAAAAAGVPVVVLDRPNPIGGLAVEGPVLHPEWSSFVGRYPLPVRHGMTIGELCLAFNEIHGIDCDLSVVPMRGWQRDMHFAETGLPWVPPSPNMPAPSTMLVYPGGCLLEGSNLSEGRGTTLPFELAGAPWLDAVRLAESLRKRDLPGVEFRAASFRPMFQKHGGRGCQGVQIIVNDRDAFRPFDTYLALLIDARAAAPEDFAWRDKVYEFESTRLAIDLLLGRADLRPMIESGPSNTDLEDLQAVWKDELTAFEATRARYLLY